MKHLQVLLDDVGTGDGAVGTVDGGLTGTGKTELGLDSLNTVGGVDVLDEGELPAGGTTLSRGDSRGSQEVLPDLGCVSHINLGIPEREPLVETYAEPSLAVLLLNLILVAHPVPVPAPQGSRVVNTDSINTLDLETSTLETVDDESKRGTSIGTREDVLVHEQTPDEVLVLPRLAETSDLQEENTIVIEHVVDLGQESAEVTDTDVLGHLETGNLLVATLDARGIAVVGA